MSPFGREEEVGLTLIPCACGYDRQEALRRIMATLRCHRPHLPESRGDGAFLENGSRMYIDGEFVEIAGPEVTDPFLDALYQRAGRRELLELARLVTEGDSWREILLFRPHSSASSDGRTTSSGSHESYFFRRDPCSVFEDLTTHLITRVAYSGGGGLDLSDRGITFLVWSRSQFITHHMSAASQRDRPLCHTRMEPLSCSGHRLHLHCADSLFSETADVLRTGLTAVTLMLRDSGVDPFERMKLSDPLLAIRTVAADTWGVLPLRLVDGRTATALEIQRAALRSIRRHLDKLPAWTPRLCDLADQTLESLQHRPERAARCVDYRTKQALFEAVALQEFGICWESLPIFNHAVRMMAPAACGLEKQGHSALLPVTTDMVTGGSRATQNAVDFLQAAGFNRDQFVRFLQCRLRLLALDKQMALLGHGLFEVFEQAGLLDHRVFTDDDIERARRHPPSDTRAALRGEAVKKYSRQRTILCEWTRVVDRSRYRFLDLADPMQSAGAEWRPCASPQERASMEMERALEIAETLYDRGAYERAADVLKPLFAQVTGASGTPTSSLRQYEKIVRLQTWIMMRLGLDPLSTLASLPAYPLKTADLFAADRWWGLQPARRMALRWQTADAALRDPDAEPALRILLGEYCGCFLLAWGDVSHALEMLRRARRENAHAQRPNERILARVIAECGEALRRLGCSKRAELLLREAIKRQETGDYQSDLAMTLCFLAKNDTDNHIAMTQLEKALAICQALPDPVGEARVRFLCARVAGCPTAATHRDRLDDLSSTIPALAQCSLTRRILSGWGWTRWTRDRAPGASGDGYWGMC